MSDAETLGWGDRWRAHLEVAAMETGEDLAAGRVIAAVLPRRTYLGRPSPSGRSVGQPIAANIDVVLIVEPMDPTPSVGRVERCAAISRSAGARGVARPHEDRSGRSWDCRGDPDGHGALG